MLMCADVYFRRAFLVMGGLVMSIVGIRIKPVSLEVTVEGPLILLLDRLHDLKVRLVVGRYVKETVSILTDYERHEDDRRTIYTFELQQLLPYEREIILFEWLHVKPSLKEELSWLAA